MKGQPLGNKIPIGKGGGWRSDITIGGRQAAAQETAAGEVLMPGPSSLDSVAVQSCMKQRCVVENTSTTLAVNGLLKILIA